jgi:hypothetical protein
MASPAAPAEPDALKAEVLRLMERAHFREAVEAGKLLHKRLANAESEALLVKAYRSRIRQMLDRGMFTESSALIDSVKQRFASAPPLLEETEWVLAARTGRPEKYLQPLDDPDLSPERRAAIETIIRREVTTPSVLSQCSALGAGHPVRQAAAALLNAFSAVTSGPVQPEAVALPGISHRSPLAPWKHLVRAIAHFHREEDALCQQHLALIDEQSVPARLVPALRAMMGKDEKPLGPAALALKKAVCGRERELHALLEQLDRALEGERYDGILFLIRRAVGLCKQTLPDQTGRLMQHICARCFLADVPPEDVRSALREPPPDDAYLWRLLARSAEIDGFPTLACSFWDSFCLCAVREGWFGENSREVAAVYLHMAGMLRGFPRTALEKARRRFDPNVGGVLGVDRRRSPAHPGPAGRNPQELHYLYPEQLYERACRIDPDPEIFQQWLEYSKKGTHWREADAAALAWHAAIPDDSRPLLHLMESAEDRNALKKALGYVEKAEKVAGLNPEVRRARLRLWVSVAKRHLKEGKTHLVDEDFAEIEALPQAQEGDRPAFLAALRWVCATLLADEPQATKWEAEVARGLESRLAAFAVLDGLETACGVAPSRAIGQVPLLASEEKSRAAAALARACVLCDDMGLPLALPSLLERPAVEALSSPDCRIDALGVQRLTEAALRGLQQELAYAASDLGLNRADTDPARFLLLRAQSLPGWDWERRENCIAAAAELARRRHDLSLLAEAVELLRGGHKSRYFRPWDDEQTKEILDIRPGEVQRVLRAERERHRFEPEPPLPGRGLEGRETAPVFQQGTLWPSIEEEEERPAGGRLDEEEEASLLPGEEEDEQEDGEYEEEDEQEYDEDAEDEDSSDTDEDEDYEDDDSIDSDDEGPSEEELQAFAAMAGQHLPPKVAALMLELVRKHGRSAELPDLEKIAKIDPELVARLDRAVRESGMSSSRPGHGSRRSPRKKRRERRKRRR